MLSRYLEHSAPLMNYKLNTLSLLVGGKGAARIGTFDVSELISALRAVDLHEHASVSLGFKNMSEIWVDGHANTAIQKLIWRAATKIAIIASAKTGIRLLPYRAVVDTISAESCVLPHCDSYVAHRLGMRLHVPITTVPGAIGVTFHPETLDPSWWKLSVSNVYAFNNFDPHTVTVCGDGSRSHLICDVLPAPAFQCSALMERNVGVPQYSSLNNSIRNIEIRNSLDARYGNLPAVDTADEQLLRSDQVQEWIQREAMTARAQNLVQSL